MEKGAKYFNFYIVFCFFLESPKLPFSVKRSKFNNLPVYTDYKRGGNLKITTIRKIKGDLKVRFIDGTWDCFQKTHLRKKGRTMLFKEWIILSIR